MNFHSLKARIFFAGKHDIPYVPVPRLTGCPGSNILTLKSATFQEWMVEWGPPFKIMSSYPRIRKGMPRILTMPSLPKQESINQSKNFDKIP